MSENDFNYFSDCFWWKRSGFSDKVLETYAACNRQRKRLHDVSLEALYKSL